MSMRRVISFFGFPMSSRDVPRLALKKNVFNHQLFSHLCGKLLKKIHTDLNKQIRKIFQVIIKSLTTDNYISVVCTYKNIFNFSYTIYVLIIRHFKFSVSRVIFSLT